MNIEKIKMAKTEYLGKNIVFYEQIESTQDKAKELVNKVPNGTIVITDEQTSGKGTKGRVWYNEKEKNIAMTIILKPNCNISKLEGFTLKIAELLKETIYELYECNLEIKKPNDLMLNNKKICGILTESVTQKEIVKVVYIGIGFNVNTTEFSKEIEGIATSLKKELDKNFERENIIREFVEKFEAELYIKKLLTKS